MKKAPLLILILLTSYLQVIPISLGATDEGYGEDENCLGQFVDSFENLNNVSVIDDVVRNSTLNLMELNFTSSIPVYENFSLYTEVDPGADITITDSRINWNTMIRNVDSYVYYDYGVANFGDFELEFTISLSDLEAGDASSQNSMTFVAMSNAFGSFADTAPVSDWVGGVILQNGANDDKMCFRLLQYTGGVNDFSDIGAIRNIGTFYCTLDRVVSTVRLRIYSDSARTTLIETLDDGGNGDNTAYRYLHGIQSWDSGANPNDHSTGYVEYLWNGSLSGGYALDGYFLTDDYLNDTNCNGMSLALMVNSSIPANTGIQVQFSNDNETWGDWEGIPLDSNILIGGFETIDLRYLNYTDIYFMFNFSSDGSDTPLLYQSRLISTIGVGAGPSGSGGIGFIILILICLPIIGLLVWRARKR